MEFEDVLEALKDGKTITNRNWNGKGMCLKAQYPDKNSLMGLPYIYMVNANGKNVPWLASQQDMFSKGWEIVGE